MEQNNEKFSHELENVPKDIRNSCEDFGGFEDKDIDDIEENIKVEEIVSRQIEQIETNPVVIQKTRISEIHPHNIRTHTTNTNNELVDILNEPENNSKLLDYSNINSQKGKRNVLSKMQLAESKYIEVKQDLDKYMKTKTIDSDNLAKQNDELLAYLDKLNDIVSICVSASKIPVKNPSFGIKKNKHELLLVNTNNNNKLINVYRNEYHKLEQRFKQVADKSYEENLENKLLLLNTDITFYEQENKKLTNLQKQSEVFIERHQKFNPNSTEMKKMHTDYESLRTLNEGLVDKVHKSKAQITENELKISQANERLEKLQKMAKEMGIEVLENVKEEAENEKKMNEKKEVLRKKMDILDRVLRTNKKKYEGEIVKNERFIVQLEKDKIQMMKILKEKTLAAYDNQQRVHEFYQQYNNSEVYLNNKEKPNEMDLYIKPRETTIDQWTGTELKTEENYIVNNKPKISFPSFKTNPEGLKEDSKTHSNVYLKNEVVEKAQTNVECIKQIKTLRDLEPFNEIGSVKNEQEPNQKVDTPMESDRFEEVEDSPPQKLFGKQKGKTISMISNNDRSMSNRISEIPSVRSAVKTERNELIVVETKSFDIVGKGSDNVIEVLESNRYSEPTVETNQREGNQVYVHKNIESRQETLNIASARQEPAERNNIIEKKESNISEQKEARADEVQLKASEKYEVVIEKRDSKPAKNIKTYESIESIDLRDLKPGTINEVVQNNEVITEQNENNNTIDKEDKSVPLFLRDYNEKDANANKSSKKEDFERRVGLQKEEEPKKRIRGAHEDHHRKFEQDAILSDNIPKVNDELRKRKEDFDNLFKDENYKTQQYDKKEQKKERKNLFEDLEEVIL
jgi:hypothetical protein